MADRKFTLARLSTATVGVAISLLTLPLVGAALTPVTDASLLGCPDGDSGDILGGVMCATDDIVASVVESVVTVVPLDALSQDSAPADDAAAEAAAVTATQAEQAAADAAVNAAGSETTDVNAAGQAFTPPLFADGLRSQSDLSFQQNALPPIVSVPFAGDLPAVADQLAANARAKGLAAVLSGERANALGTTGTRLAVLAALTLGLVGAAHFRYALSDLRKRNKD